MTNVASETTGPLFESHCSSRNHCQPCLSVPEDVGSLCEPLPKSPISPRIKNIREDMEALMLSRHDNPYIMHQLERLSTKDSDILGDSIVSAHSSPARNMNKASVSNLNVNGSAESNFIMDSDVVDCHDDNLHDKLIRSPPPQFPKNMSLFVFPGSSAPSVNSLRTGEASDSMSMSCRLHLSPYLSSHSRDECKDSDSANLMRHDLRRNRFLDNSHDSYAKYERRGSDSSIMSNNWKTAFFNQSMTASSSSLLSYVPRCPPINSCASASNDSYMSFNECEANEVNQKSANDLMEVYPHIEDNSNHFMSPSNSREALLKDISQMT